LVIKAPRRERGPEMYMRRELRWERKRQDRSEAWNLPVEATGMGAF